jgi:hypothetical protein
VDHVQLMAVVSIRGLNLPILGGLHHEYFLARPPVRDEIFADYNYSAPTQSYE